MNFTQNFVEYFITPVNCLPYAAIYRLKPTAHQLPFIE